MAAFAVLGTGTISDVKVERLAKDLGVTKGSFYWHFADRGALLEAMRRVWVRMGTEQIIELVEADEPPEPREALGNLIGLTLASSGEFDGVEGAIREWSAHDPETARVCVAVDERRLSYVADLLVAAGMTQKEAVDRAAVLYRIIIGDYVYRRYGGNPVDIEAVQDVIDRLFR